MSTKSYCEISNYISITKLLCSVCDLNVYSVLFIRNSFRTWKKDQSKTVRCLGRGRRIIIQQDNDPQHTSISVTSWFKQKKIVVLTLRSIIPYLINVENYWCEQKIRIISQIPKNFRDLVQVAIEEWNHIPVETCTNQLNNNMKRLLENIMMKGSATD